MSCIRLLHDVDILYHGVDLREKFSPGQMKYLASDEGKSGLSYLLLILSKMKSYSLWITCSYECIFLIDQLRATTLQNIKNIMNILHFIEIILKLFFYL